jgi:mono/diheme cytochrome c family protein
MAVCLPMACVSARAQGSMPHSNVGKTPTQEEIKAWDIAVGPSGKELPPGSGTAKQGAVVFAAKCSMCHGAELQGNTGGDPNFVMAAPALVGGFGTLKNFHPVRKTGNYLPFATTIYDFINRAMPRFEERTLKPDEVYATTALILYKNGIIKEDFVIDAKTLPEIQMPNRKNFLPTRFEDIADLQKRGCHQGQCGELTNRPELKRDTPWPPPQ